MKKIASRAAALLLAAAAGPALAHPGHGQPIDGWVSAFMHLLEPVHLLPALAVGALLTWWVIRRR